MTRWPSSFTRFSPIAAGSLIVGIAVAGAVAGGPQDGPQDRPATTTIETTAGARESGVLAAIEPEQVRLTTPDGERTLAVTDVRTISVAGGGPRPSGRTRLIGTDGMRLSGADVAWDGERLTLLIPDGAIVVPAMRAHTVIWDRTADPAPQGDPEWLAALPEELDSDVVVVAKGEGVQFVTCAITGISTDAVTVVLDGETIPVKRDRVVGLRWLREPSPPGGVIVRVAGGMLPAARVAWSPDALIVDDVRMPSSILEAIDYAAGRTVRLAMLPTERLEVEPFFGGLASIEGIAGYFRPRVVQAAGDSPARDLVMRPRTTAVWRVPPGSRTFAATFSGEGSTAAHGSVVVIAVDGAEVFRGVIDQASAGAGPREKASIGPIPVPSSRRLSIMVDYGTAGPAGGGVTFHDPVFEK